MRIFAGVPVLAVLLVVNGCDVYYSITRSKYEIRMCELHAETALRFERHRLKGIPQAALTDYSDTEGIMSQEYIDSQLRLIDDIYNHKLGNSMDEIQRNAKRKCLKNPVRNILP